MHDVAAPIRPLDPNDDLSKFGPQHGPDVDEPRRRRTLVAALDGALAGAATLMWSRRHPDLVQAQLTVEPRHRRQGLGTALLQALEGLADRPLLFTTDDEDGAAAFLLLHGYCVATRSRTYRVDTAAVDRVLAPFAQVRTPAQITPFLTITPDIERLYDDIYADRHQWAGRYTPPVGAPWVDFCGPLVPHTLYVATVDGAPVGVTSLHTGPFADGADAFLPPTGTIGALSQPDRIAVLGRLLANTITAAVRLGISSINVEVDTDYRELETLVDGWQGTAVMRRCAWTRPL